jgi:hypothetical protein
VNEMSVDELLRAVDDLSEPEFDQLVDRVLWLRARRKAPILEPAETELLLEINQGIPAELHQNYQALREKRDDESLTEEEQAELIEISNQMEMIGAKRLEALAKLADIRRIPLLKLMDDLGIQGASFD